MIFFLLRKVNVDQLEFDIFFFQSIHEENVHDFCMIVPMYITM